MNITRLLLIYQLSYNNIKLIDQEEQRRRGIVNIFEDDQFCFEDVDYGVIIMPIYNILYIHLHPHGSIPKNSIPVRRITLEYEITYQNAYLVREKDYKINNIPTIFGNHKQFTYYVKGFGLFMSLDNHVVQIQY